MENETVQNSEEEIIEEEKESEELDELDEAEEETVD